MKILIILLLFTSLAYAETATDTLKLRKPAFGDTNWHTPVNSNMDVIDSAFGSQHNLDGTHRSITGDSVAVFGADTEIFFNDGGIMSSDAGCVYDRTTDTLTINGPIAAGGVNSRVTFVNDEYIDNTTDDLIGFVGVGGADNTDLRLDLDGLYPVLTSPTDRTVKITKISADAVSISGDVATGGVIVDIDHNVSADIAQVIFNNGTDSGAVLKLGDGYLWVSKGDVLRFSLQNPVSDDDGMVVGGQS